ncbi:MAG: head-tail connector protein [Oscillospiraceae bacterium]|jgi:uncharacterized phage protein (predicted DNA packaging)|nr:head-tail connector protein [Oscillospiraceae bacterium]
MATTDELLVRVKTNLILETNEDDELLKLIIESAVDYAETRLNVRVKYGSLRQIPLRVRQAIVMLASHWYESRDGSTGGFYADNPAASTKTMEAVNNLLDSARRHSL